MRNILKKEVKTSLKGYIFMKMSELNHFSKCHSNIFPHLSASFKSPKIPWLPHQGNIPVTF